MSQTRRHYSGDGSAAFWRRVNALTDADRRGAAYFSGVLLQELEERVLVFLEQAELNEAPRSAKAKRSRKGAK